MYRHVTAGTWHVTLVATTIGLWIAGGDGHSATLADSIALGLLEASMVANAEKPARKLRRFSMGNSSS
jgi:hypothetical protein